MLESILGFSQSTGIYAFMNTPWGWPLAESIHFIGLCLLIGTVGVFDLRMLGMAPGVAYADLHRLVPLGVAGYFLNVVTGVMFFTTAPDQYLFNPAFQTKLFFMLIAGVNMLVFYTTTSAQVKRTRAVLVVPLRARAIAAISLACWCAVIIGGRLITYYRPPYYWCAWC